MNSYTVWFIFLWFKMIQFVSYNFPFSTNILSYFKSFIYKYDMFTYIYTKREDKGQTRTLKRNKKLEREYTVKYFLLRPYGTMEQVGPPSLILTSHMSVSLNPSCSNSISFCWILLRKQGKVAQVPGPLPPSTWEIQMELLAPNFCLTQPSLLQKFSGLTQQMEISFFVNFLFQINKFLRQNSSTIESGERKSRMSFWVYKSSDIKSHSYIIS